MIREALIASVVGGLLWLDRFQIFQIMLSRPIVCAPIIGWSVGDLEAGLASGILFELLWLRRPPVGGYIPPDASLASIATAAVSSLVRADTGAPLEPAVFLSFLFLFPVAYLGNGLDRRLRTDLGRIARRAEKTQPREDERGLRRYFALALILGFCLASFVLFPIILSASLALTELAQRLSPAFMRALGFGFYVVPLLGTADLMAGLSEKRYFVLFLIGFVVSLGCGLVLGL
jgi:PTS system mannose-specific IIC component